MNKTKSIQSALISASKQDFVPKATTPKDMEQLYADIQPNGLVAFYSSYIHTANQIPKAAIKISKQNHHILLDGINNNHVVYICQYTKPDEHGNHIKLRHKHTKLIDNKVIEDKEAIITHNANILKHKAKALFDECLKHTHGYYWNKLTKKQQTALIHYLDQLQNIIDDKDNTITSLPKAPF